MKGVEGKRGKEIEKEEGGEGRGGERRGGRYMTGRVVDETGVR